MADALAGANYVYLVPGVAAYLVSVLFRTVRWRVLLSHLSQVRVARLYPVVVVGYMANNLLPLRLGELVRSYHVGEREGLSKTSALATIMVERVLDALTLLFFILAIALFVPLSGLAESLGERTGVPWPLVAAAFSAPFVLVFCLMVLLASYPARTRAAIDAGLGLLPDRLGTRVRELVRMFLEGFIPLRSTGTLGLLFALSLPIWLLESLLFFFVGFSFGLDGVFDNLAQLAAMAVLVTAVANIGSSVPAAPGGIGLFELIARETLVLLPLATIDRAVAAGFATVVHAALLLPMIVLGQIFLWSEHVSLGGLFNAGRRLSTGSEGPTGGDAKTAARDDGEDPE